MSVLITADLHLSSKARDVYRFAAMEQIADLILSERVEELLILGDLTESKNNHAATLVNDVVELLHSFSCLCPVTILRGNHDYTDPTTPFFFFTRLFDRVRWINTPTELSKLNGGPALFLPHTTDCERDWAGVDPQAYDLIFAHNTFEGASAEHGKRLSGISLSVFRKSTRVISGDIHTPQTLGPVTYVGSPYTVDFGDDFEPRVLLLAGEQLRSIPLTGPQKRMLEVKVGDGLVGFEFNSGDILKVRCHLTAAEAERWPSIKAEIRAQLERRGGVVYLIQPVVETGAVRLLAERTVKRDETLIEEFAKRSGWSPETVRVGLDLAQRA